MRTDKGQKKKQYILAQARQLFIQKGYAATSMEELVHFSGVSKGSIYYHFKNKIDLFTEVLFQHWDEWTTQWYEKEKDYQSFIEKLYGVAIHYAEDFQHPLVQVSEEFFLRHSDMSMVSEMMKKAGKQHREIYASIFAEAIAEGQIKGESPEELAVIFGGLLDGLGTLYYEGRELKPFYRKGVKYFLEGVLARG
ncbi:TetR/AcrR family transcriptional regulator [Shouchella lonarensis]|nr:TetR/AcrR family transcriptional regulator [Shouchella lonarensis]